MEAPPEAAAGKSGQDWGEIFRCRPIRIYHIMTTLSLTQVFQNMDSSFLRRYNIECLSPSVLAQRHLFVFTGCSQSAVGRFPTHAAGSGASSDYTVLLAYIHISDHN